MTFRQQLTDYINACFTGLWVHTFEPDEAQTAILNVATEKEWHCLLWDIARGHGTPTDRSNPGDPLAPFAAAAEAAMHNDKDDTTIIVLHNYHKYLSNPMVAQRLFNEIIEGKARRLFFVVLSPTTQIPQELEKVFVILEHTLPDRQQIEQIAKELLADDKNQVTVSPNVIEAAAGLTHYEAEGAFSLSIARHGDILEQEIWELKMSALKKSGLLEMYRGKETFADLGGMEALKGFCKRALNPSKVKPKGILLLGVPGTGKSAFAKALGNETGRPTLTLDIGSLFGSLVGQTEQQVRQALKIADAMAPCILFVDEIEKALSGQGTNNDGGAATRMFGTLLTWLNDHTTDVFFIATCNDLSQLPKEFSRAERFDAIFFLDMPTEDERAQIWQMYEEQFQVFRVGQQFPPDQQWTGAEIKACCRLAALLQTTLAEAAKNIVPVAKTAADKVSGLREWASGKCLSASTGGIYSNKQPTAINGKRRQIAIKD